MATKKLFITGATGFVGGNVLDSLVKSHPDLQISALLRSTRKEFTERYPSVSIVSGTFDDFEIIEEAAYDVDVVIHAGDSDHEGCTRAILSGLSKRKSPSFLIHLSGTALISDMGESTWDGLSNPKIWSDIEDIDALYNFPDTAAHHKIDRLIQDASNDLLRTTIICPPDIYGRTAGVGNRTSFLVPLYVEALLKGKEPFYLGPGENFRAVVHIDDIVDLFVLLVDEALLGGGKAQWGREGFYFGVSHEVAWKDVAEAVNRLGRGQEWLAPDSQTVSYNATQLRGLIPGWPPWFSLYMWGSNSRASSDRAKRLGWRPKAPDFWASLPGDVEDAFARYSKSSA